jgi:hypothetical protein
VGERGTLQHARFQESGAVTSAGLVAAGVKADTARPGRLIAFEPLK